MTDQQKEMLAALSRCTFGWGTNEKRFVSDLVAEWRKIDLTPRQDWYLRRTYYRYRKQIGHHGTRPADFDSPPEKEPTAAEEKHEVAEHKAAGLMLTRIAKRQARELARLHAWNSGKPR